MEFTLTLDNSILNYECWVTVSSSLPLLITVLPFLTVLLVSFSSYISIVSRSSLMQTTTHFSYSFASKPLFWFCFEGLRFLAAFWLVFFFFATLKIIFCWFVCLRGRVTSVAVFQQLALNLIPGTLKKIVLFLKNVLFGMIFLPFYDDEGRWNSLYALESSCDFW